MTFPSSPTVGSTFVEVLRFLGRRLEARLEITELDPDRRFSLRALSGPMPFEVRHTLEPIEGGRATEVRVELEGEPRGLFKLGESLVTRQARRQVEGDLARLKTAVETRTEVPGPATSVSDTS